MKKSLWERLRPDIKEKLLKNRNKYWNVITRLTVALENNFYYTNLTMRDYMDLIQYGTDETFPKPTEIFNQ